MTKSLDFGVNTSFLFYAHGNGKLRCVHIVQVFKKMNEKAKIVILTAPLFPYSKAVWNMTSIASGISVLSGKQC
jgi:hypothetical protein